MAQRFKGTTVAQLQAIHDGLVSYLSSGLVAAGVAAYQIAQRTITKISIKDAQELLNEVSNELAVRALPDQTEIGLAELDDPADGHRFTSRTPPW